MWVAAAAMAVCVFLAWRASSKADAALTERQRGDSRRSELSLWLERSEAALAALPSPPVVVVPVLAEKRPPAPAGPRAADSLIEWLEDPRIQVLFQAHERAMLQVSYGPFFQVQRLTTVQVERVSDLIVKSLPARSLRSESPERPRFQRPGNGSPTGSR
jgi:hypothetical protein